MSQLQEMNMTLASRVRLRSKLKVQEAAGLVEEVVRRVATKVDHSERT